MNKKGFAISIVLYAIVFLIVTILYILLGIMKNRFVVSSGLRESITDSMNTVERLIPSKESCTLIPDNSTYTENLKLKIDVSNGKAVLYSFDHENWNVYNTSEKINEAGIHLGYFKDNFGNEGHCSINVVSKVMYRYRECLNNDILYNNWYWVSTENSDSCTAITKSDAESSHSNEYITCDGGLKTIYHRDPAGCNWTNEEWSSWQESRPTSDMLRQIEDKRMYKVG